MKKLILSLCVLSLTACSSSKHNGEASEHRQPATVPGRVYKLYGFNVPLHDLEEVPAEEPAAIDSLNEIMMGLFKNEYPAKGATKDPATGMSVEGTRRGVHPRAHGCAEGVLKVRMDLKNEAGIFLKGAEYPVTARFSNGSPKATADDSAVDTRGFAMKVHNVPGQNLLGSDMRLGDMVSQDFTLNSTEPFFSDNAARYSQFMKILTFESASLEEAGKKFFLRLLKEGHPIVAYRILKAFKAIQNHKTTTPLGISYFSILPFQHGFGPEAPIVKYKVEPCKGAFNAPVTKGDKFYLRHNLAKGMESQGACFRFMLQERKNSWTLEDPTFTWSQSQSPYYEIAQIHFPKQKMMDEMACEKLVINPWNTIPEHKPVGGINRIRLPTYLLSVQKRRETNKY